MIIHTSYDFDVPASIVWDLFGERFADVADFSSAIDKSALDQPITQGAIRTCDLKAFGPIPAGQVTEEVTLFDREARKLTFVVLSGVPGFMRHVENAWAVEPLGKDRCRITSRARFDLAWYMLPMAPLLGMQLRRGLQTFVREIEQTVTNAPATATPVAAAV